MDISTTNKERVQRIMDIARKFRSAPGDQYDPAYKDLQEAIYLALEEVSYAAPKDHEIAQFVNRLTDVGKEYGAAQQLRDRISFEVISFIRKPKPALIEAPIIKQKQLYPFIPVYRKAFPADKRTDTVWCFIDLEQSNIMRREVFSRGKAVYTGPLAMDKSFSLHGVCQVNDKVSDGPYSVMSIAKDPRIVNLYLQLPSGSVLKFPVNKEIDTTFKYNPSGNLRLLKLDTSFTCSLRRDTVAVGGRVPPEVEMLLNSQFNSTAVTQIDFDFKIFGSINADLGDTVVKSEFKHGSVRLISEPELSNGYLDTAIAILESSNLIGYDLEANFES